ncbi:MAG: TrbC/VirB2 family protein [Propionivibrio sp.]
MTNSQTLLGFSLNSQPVERVLAALPLLIAIAALLLLSAGFASASSMPWEGPLCQVATSLQGPVARGVAVIAIVVCGLMLAVGEVGGVFKTMLGLLAGVSMALLANSWLGFIGGSGSSFVGSC